MYPLFIYFLIMSFQNPFEKFDFDYNIQLSCNKREEILPYLLIVCDTVQDWDRFLKCRIKYDNNQILLEKFEKNEPIEGDRVFILKKLIDVSNNNNKINLTIDHTFEEIVLQQSNSDSKLKLETAYKHFLEKDFEKITKKLPVYVNIHENDLILPKNKEIDKNKIEIKKLTNFILTPIENRDYGYEIIIKHFLKGSPYATAHFYL